MTRLWTVQLRLGAAAAEAAETALEPFAISTSRYEVAGGPVWEVAAPQPLAAHRMPNGNTLVALQQWPANRVIEVDRAGKQVGETTTQSFTVRAKRR